MLRTILVLIFLFSTFEILLSSIIDNRTTDKESSANLTVPRVVRAQFYTAWDDRRAPDRLDYRRIQVL